mgnify:FL=1
MKNEILRKCIVCRELKNRENLIKITKNHDNNEIVLNPDSKTFGRSAYLCYNKNCIKDSLKKNKLDRCLKTFVSDKIKAELQSLQAEE